ncbi:Fic family protein [Dyella psychrodurans]|uniref:Fic family protein n=1 Tax=Dyella psychrodurans TaxID=1927960 RepID=A0A370X2U6_9GAMM|nr:Fic family protein [Dyella psychrodurans]RDS82617.1 Fic family protein [Dyella psychrodurans]
MSVEWIWQQPHWPKFTWVSEDFASLLAECHQSQGKLLGMAGTVDKDDLAKRELNTLLQNIVNSSKIEGEHLNEDAIRSSLAKRLGVVEAGSTRPSLASEGLAELILDATTNYDAPLDLDRLKWWHTLLFPGDQASYVHKPILVGALRKEDPMQVVSGPENRRRVHFEAPPSAKVGRELQSFLKWFESTRESSDIDPFVRAAIAQFWFVTIHPFEDGNGRMARALTDLALSQAEHQSIRLYSMSLSILNDRVGYYNVLESCQKSGMDITPWLVWFLKTLKNSLDEALARIAAVVARMRFWRDHEATELQPEQRRFLTRMLRELDENESPTFSARNYRNITSVSKPTASRHLADLIAKGCIVGVDSGKGPGARYKLAL